MQALAIGIPVVSTTVGSIPDVVIEGKTGFVVPPRDAGDRLVGKAADRVLVGALSGDSAG
jgi:glycosyltransferase involved in cell wall biosynthesis